MTQGKGSIRASFLLNIAVATAFAAAAAALIFIVRTNLRAEALRESAQTAKLLLDRNLATHAYFTNYLKPAVFPLSDRVMPPDYFEPVWMSSTYVVREMNRLSQEFETSDYSYKECAINARSPENEADAFERDFIERLNRDPALQVETAERVIDGKPYFTVLRRGESMQQSCLRCHDTPERAPGGLVAHFGPTRSFHRHENEVVSAISIRIPLAVAFAHADRTILQISVALCSTLLGILGLQLLINRRFIFAPLRRVGLKAREISTDEGHLGEEIVVPRGRELADLCVSFNQMSLALRDSRDRLEQTVAERTADLRAANEGLTRALADIKTLSGLIPICAACKKIRDDQGYWQQVESYITARSDVSFSHGLCPECLPAYFPEQNPQTTESEREEPLP